MPEEQEIETRELQETLAELHEERKERTEEERRSGWLRYIAVSTACLAVFAAIAALESGNHVNEAMILQLKASDRWNEYQADRQKDHLYRIHAYELLDRGIVLPGQDGGHENPQSPPIREGGAAVAGRRAGSDPGAESRRAGSDPGAKDRSAGGDAGTQGRPSDDDSESDSWRAAPAEVRLHQFVSQITKEARKEDELKTDAERLESESEHEMALHHRYAQAVALIQVAIALAAVSALTRMKSVWGLSLAVGLGGVALFFMGLLAL